jgi:hypothetical protein
MSQVRIGVCTLTSGTAKEVGDQAQEGMLSVFRSQPGCKAYELAETQGGKIVSVRPVGIRRSGSESQRPGSLLDQGHVVVGTTNRDHDRVVP